MNEKEGFPSTPVEQQVSELAILLQNNMASMQQTLKNITDSVSGLQTDFETKIKYDDSKERTISLLHKELQDYREDLNFKHLRPLIMDLINLYDDMNLIAAKYQGAEQMQEVSDAASNITVFTQDIEEILNRYGFEIYQVDNEVFDRTLQNARKTVTTDRADLDCHIVERMRRGLRYGERIIRPEIVSVYRYTAPVA